MIAGRTMALDRAQGLFVASGGRSVFNAAPAGVLIAAALLLGGGARPGFLSDSILQIVAIFALLAALYRWPTAAEDRLPVWELALCAAFVLVPVIQLVPLPQAIWSHLPGAELRTTALELINREPTWAQISLQPNATWLSLVGLLPPLAMFLATLSLGYRERRLICLVLLTVGVFAAFIGLAQVAQGPNSPLRPFLLTNPTEAVGFFANRNHFAALINVLLPFVTAWAVYMITPAADDQPSTANQGRFDPRLAISAIAGFTVLVALLAAEAMARSRAGLGIAMLALVACYLLTWNANKPSRERKARGVTSSRLILAAVGLAVLMIMQFALYRILDRFEADPLQDARVIFGQRTFEAGMAYLPFGSGLGSFVSIYASREQARDALMDVYANHAHNDFLEVWLETGVLGLAVLVAFLGWWAWRSIAAWRSALPGAETLDIWLARAASVVIVILLLHSVFDYPMRTGALMVTFAFACAVLVAPLHPAPVRAPAPAAMRDKKPEPRRERMPASPRAAHPDDVIWPSQTGANPDPVKSQTTKPGGQWTPDAAWPDAWSTPQEPAGPARRPAPPRAAQAETGRRRGLTFHPRDKRRALGYPLGHATFQRSHLSHRGSRDPRQGHRWHSSGAQSRLGRAQWLGQDDPAQNHRGRPPSRRGRRRLPQDGAARHRGAGGTGRARNAA